MFRLAGRKPTLLSKFRTAKPSCLRLFWHCARAAASRTFCTAGTSRAIKTAIMAMTTSSSISVKAARLCGFRALMVIPRSLRRLSSAPQTKRLQFVVLLFHFGDNPGSCRGVVAFGKRGTRLIRVLIDAHQVAAGRGSVAGLVRGQLEISRWVGLGIAARHFRARFPLGIKRDHRVGNGLAVNEHP